MNILIKSLRLENFKGIKELNVNFGEKVIVKGANGTGKTTIVDAFTWLLFNKDSHGVTDFQIRPLNEDGTPVNFVEIKVSAVLDVDGKEIEFSKTQKQNWIKQRGTEKAVFKGNVNEYSIDGYPKSEKEYKEVINGIISEDMFKILTSPTYFANMKWKDQRDILMRFATTESDIELAKRIGGFDAILDELEKAPSTEDILNKYKKSKKELETSLKEIPVRIDELSKQIVEIDLAELELKKKALEEKSGIEKKVIKDIDDLKNEQFELGFKINDYSRKANATVIQNRTDAETALTKASAEYQKSCNEVSSINIKLLQVESARKNAGEESAGLGLEYKKLKAQTFDESEWVFDEKSKTCRMCGQTLPKEKIDAMVKDFEIRKANAKKGFEENIATKTKKLLDRGNELKEIIETKDKEIAGLNAELETAKAKSEELKQKAEYFHKVFEELPERVDLSNDEGYNALLNRQTEIDKKIEELKSSINPVEVTSVDNELREIEKHIASIANNEQFESRIAQLQEEQRDISQRIANCESLIFTVENFIKAKLDVVSESVNANFELVKYKLFDTQINGAIVECCVPTIHGVEFGDLNNGHRVVAGLDIIRTLSKLLDVSPSVFVDNAECVNDFNIPKMDCQMILLYVSEDKELKVE